MIDVVAQCDLSQRFAGCHAPWAIGKIFTPEI
jgi:hypothetical protein